MFGGTNLKIAVNSSYISSKYALFMAIFIFNMSPNCVLPGFGPGYHTDEL